MPRETSAAIGELFRGFSGYVQADAKSVYDLLFKPAAERPPLDDGEPDLDDWHEGRVLEPLPTQGLGGRDHQQGSGRP